MEDNFRTLADEARQLPEKSVRTGKPLGGLIRSTEVRKPRLLALLSPVFALLSHGA